MPEEFNIDKFKEELSESESIDSCPKVPIPYLKEDQTYIFISYSHKDYKKVYSDIADMYGAGVRFLYDRGLPPDKDWDIAVEGMIRNPRCSGVIFYISKNLFLSKSIRREIAIVTGVNEITGEKEREPMAKFCVNLTGERPSVILKRCLLEEENGDLDSRWIVMLMNTFSDNGTWYGFDMPHHKAELIEAISNTFNVVNDGNIVATVDGIYRGEMKNGMRHGKGVCEYPNGFVYDGEWEDDLRSGYGILSRNGDTVYDGEWRSDLKEGKGVYRYTNGAVYDGEWQKDKRHGKGKYDYGDGKRFYDGEWCEDRLEGKGLFIYGENSTYEGEFLNWCKEGHGVRKYDSGAVYDGEWRKDKRHGKGKYDYGDGKRSYDGEWCEDRMEGFGRFIFKTEQGIREYEGEFVNWNYEGQGVLKYENGNIYDGEWKSDKWEGMGTHTYADGKSWTGEFRNGVRFTGNGFIYYYKDGKPTGATYEGELCEGKYNGFGRYTYSDKAVYEGEWKDGKREGKGKYDYSDGKRSYDGEWHEDRLEGKGLFIYGENNTYEGEFSNWCKEGHGVRKYDNGAVYDGEWRKDNRHGKGKYDYGDGKRSYEGEWCEDRMEGFGRFIFKTEQGISEYEGEFVNWNYEGQGVLKYENGNIYDGEWKSDKWEGTGTYTYADGKSWTGEFRNDERFTGNGFIYYYKDGKLTGETYEGELCEGKYNGFGRYTYSDKAVYEGEWKDGKREGKGKYDYSDGKRSYDGEWCEDRMEGFGRFIFKKEQGIREYEGEFVNWNYEGQGVLKYENGNIYDGEWKSNKWEGTGTYTYADGKSWTGEFRNDERFTGNGFIYYYKNGKLTGETYEGELREGRWNGFGRYTYANKSFYEGEWKDGVREGKGICETVNALNGAAKIRYEGLWKKGKMIEGVLSTFRITMNDDSYKLVSIMEGKLNYNSDLIGLITVKNGRRTRKRISIPEWPLLLPNLWIFRKILGNPIWQFEGETSETPEGKGVAVYYYGEVVDGWFRNGDLDESKPYTVTMPDGSTYTGGDGK